MPPQVPYGLCPFDIESAIVKDSNSAIISVDDRPSLATPCFMEIYVRQIADEWVVKLARRMEGKQRGGREGSQAKQLRASFKNQTRSFLSMIGKPNTLQLG